MTFTEYDDALMNAETSHTKRTRLRASRAMREQAWEAGVLSERERISEGIRKLENTAPLVTKPETEYRVGKESISIMTGRKAIDYTDNPNPSRHDDPNQRLDDLFEWTADEHSAPESDDAASED